MYQSIDDGLTWSLFPSTTFGAVAQGGNLPHAAVTDLDLSLGNIDIHTGMPNLAGPYDPTKSDGDAGPRRPAGHDLRPRLVRHQPGPAGLPQHGQARSQEHLGDRGRRHSDGEHRPPIFNGLSAITGFGNATRITIMDVTDPDQPEDHRRVRPQPASTNVAANWTDAFGNFAVQVRPGHAFTTNGLKTIQIYATDDAGAVGNKVTLTFTSTAAARDADPGDAPADDTGTLGDNITILTAAPLHRRDGSGRDRRAAQVGTTTRTYISFNPAVITTSVPDGSFTLTFPNPASGARRLQRRGQGDELQGFDHQLGRELHDPGAGPEPQAEPDDAPRGRLRSEG